MPARRLTKRIIDQLAPRAVEYTAWDAELRGFGVRVRPSGAKTYIVRYRPGGGRSAPIRRMMVAAVGAHGITPEQARAQAKALLAAAIQGADPARERSDRRRAESLGDLFEGFLARHVRTKCKAVTVDGYASLFRKHVAPVLGGARARDVTRGDVARLHHAMRQTPYQAGLGIRVNAL